MEKQSNPFYSDEEYIKSNSLQCRLIVQHAENSVFILVIDNDRNLRYWAETDTESFIRQPHFYDNLKFATTELLTIPETFAFMPFDLEDKKGQPNYDAVLLSEEQEHIFHEKMLHQEVNHKFTIRESASSLEQKLGGARIIPSSNILIKCVADKSKPAQRTFGIHFYEQEFEIAYFDQQKFTFYNRFPMAHVDDFNYFLLAVLEQFHIPTGEATFYLSGDISETDESYRRIQKYSQDIHFLRIEVPFNLPASLKSPHRFGLLLALASCVLLEEH